MKKIVMLMVLVMCVVSVTNAAMIIVVDIGDGLWADYADSKLVIEPSDTILIGVLDVVGQTQPGSLALGLAEGPGSLDASNLVTSANVAAIMKDDATAAATFGVQNPFVLMEITGAAQGLLLRSLVFHCDGPGDVTLYLVDQNGQVVDSQVIHQIPEPMTVALLGLGSLAMMMYRKRSA